MVEPLLHRQFRIRDNLVADEARDLNPLIPIRRIFLPLPPPGPPGSIPEYQTSSPYYAPHPQDLRGSPYAYGYEVRHSSPHGSPFPPMVPPQSGPTPPPSTSASTPSGSARARLNVRDMLNPGEPHTTRTCERQENIQ
ncbi:hypothetical protein N7451_012287 [Penicillium sp. IBT 35674x]|nr:hypothetical protein N7451_012287 [Penicillium sp. IBT 35674x]